MTRASRQSIVKRGGGAGITHCAGAFLDSRVNSRVFRCSGAAPWNWRGNMVIAYRVAVLAHDRSGKHKCGASGDIAKPGGTHLGHGRRQLMASVWYGGRG